MNASPLSHADLSLYELVLASDHPPTPLKVSPTTFKSSIEAVMALLTQQEISATVWAKLPSSKVWEASIQQYCQSGAESKTVYLLKRQREEADPNGTSTAPTQLNPLHVNGEAATLPSLEDDDPDASEPATMESSDASDVLNQPDDESKFQPSTTVSRFEVWLSSETHLRREYFLLVVAAGFHLLVIAHRPRSARQAIAHSSPAMQGMGTIKATRAIVEEGERKVPLLSLYSFNPAAIRQVMVGLQQVVQHDALPDQPTVSNLDDLLQQWNQAQPAADAGLDPTLMEQFWTIQTQQQEEVWRTSSTARKQAETASELQLENEELVNAIRLKDEFFKTVGQELRTPLATMKTALSLLNSPNLKPNQRQRYMELLSQECDRQSSLITSVLDLVQLENVDEQAPLQPLRIHDIVPGVVSTYQPLAQEKGIMLAYTIPEDLPAVSCLGAWLRQVVINLLHNSIKFTPEGGHVWVKAKQQGDYIQLEFRDTGIGIAPTDIPKIFNRFYRVRPVGGEDSSGAGLGLSIVQQLLLRCGGSISVQSKQGEGSVFNVLLPLYRRDG